MSFEELRSRDFALSKVAAGVENRIPAVTKGLPLEATCEAMSNLVGSLESLKSGILNLAGNGNFYATSVLFRVFLEHMLKLLGLFQTATNERNDEFAQLYLGNLAVEASQYLRAIRASKLPEGSEATSPLAPWFDEADRLSRSDIKFFEEPFKYKALIERIAKYAELDEPNILNKIIPNYSELSGFVHGGPSTAVILASLPSREAKESRLLRNAELVLSMFCSAKQMLLMLAAAVQPELNPVLKEFEDALDSR